MGIGGDEKTLRLFRSSQKAKGKRQKAKGKRQKAKGNELERAGGISRRDAEILGIWVVRISPPP
jgi:hypothetical protein